MFRRRTPPDDEGDSNMDAHKWVACPVDTDVCGLEAVVIGVRSSSSGPVTVIQCPQGHQYGVRLPVLHTVDDEADT